MKLRFSWIAVLLSVFCVRAFSQESTFEFLRNDVGARAAALGGSFLSMENDPNSLFYNPGAFGTLESRSLSFGFFKDLMDINSGYASFGTQVPGLGVVGGGVTYVNYGTFAETGLEGENLGTFSAGEMAMGVAYGAELAEGLHYGFGAKYIYSSIAGYSSSGAAIDMGLHYVAVPQRLYFGASLLNLGTQFNPYITTREPLPLDFRVGMAIMPEHLPATILFDIQRINEQQTSVAEHLRAFTLGVEFTVSRNVQLRAGYNNAERQDLQFSTSPGIVGFSLGFGIVSGLYRFDYAFNSLGSIGALHRISIGMNI